MISPKLALIPSGYKNSKVYSILPNNGGGDFTFARNSGATRVRKDGLIETVAADTPRLDWSNGNCPNLLIEPLRTNRQIRSEEFDNAAWTKRADMTVTANQVTAPTGQLTADKVKRGSTVAANNYLSDGVSKSSSAQLDACTSVFVKQGDGDFFAFRAQGTYPNRMDAIFQFSNTTLTTSVSGADFTVTSSKVENYGNGWYRLSVVYNTDAAATIISLFSPRGTSGQVDSSDTSTSAFVYLWGFQVEEGASLTSYIETQGSTTTRNADTCTNAGDANTFNDNEGVLYAEISALADDNTHREISLSNGTTDNRISLFYGGASNRIRAEIKRANVTIFNSFTTNYDVKNINKIAVKYKSSDYSFYINGTQIGSSTTTGSFNANTLNTLDFKRHNTPSTFFYGKCKDLRYYDTALTDAELTELTK